MKAYAELVKNVDFLAGSAEYLQTQMQEVIDRFEENHPKATVVSVISNPAKRLGETAADAELSALWIHLVIFYNE